MMVSDHGFGPCLGRIHVNKILAGRRGRAPARLGGSPRVPDHAGGRSAPPVGREARPARGAFGVVRPVGGGAVPLRLEADPRLRPPSGHRRDGLCRHPRRPPRRREDRRADDDPSRRSTRPDRPPPPPWPKPATPRPAVPLFPQIIATAEAYKIDPASEGYPDLIALPDDPQPGLHQALVQPEPGSSPTTNLPGTPPPRGDRRPRRRRPPARPPPQGQPDRRDADHPGPPRPADPGPHRGEADRHPRRDQRLPPRPRPDPTPAPCIPPRPCRAVPTRSPSIIPSRSRKSSSSAWPELGYLE